jgi:hypothetical protein
MITCGHITEMNCTVKVLTWRTLTGREVQQRRINMRCSTNDENLISIRKIFELVVLHFGKEQNKNVERILPIFECFRPKTGPMGLAAIPKHHDQQETVGGFVFIDLSCFSSGYCERDEPLQENKVIGANSTQFVSKKILEPVYNFRGIASRKIGEASF